MAKLEIRSREGEWGTDIIIDGVPEKFCYKYTLEHTYDSLPKITLESHLTNVDLVDISLDDVIVTRVVTCPACQKEWEAEKGAE